MRGRFLFAIWAAIFLVPCLLRADTSQKQELKDGYFLLHQLMDDESNVDMLFIVKDAPDQISTFAKQISQTAKDTQSAIDEMEDKTPWLHTDQTPLPQIELDVRASIKEDKQHQLVFGTTGTEFIRAFLQTQIQASTYAINLTKVLAEKETNPHRAEILRNKSAQWQKIRDNAFRILRDY